MPKNHGIVWLERDPYSTEPSTPAYRVAPRFRFGVSRLFNFSSNTHLSMSEAQRDYATRLEYHARTIASRLLFSLQRLSTLMPILCSHVDKPLPDQYINAQFEAECYADHVLTYLNMVLDDVASAVALHAGCGFDSSTKIESMGDLKTKCTHLPAAQVSITQTLGKLDDQDSWWNLAFKPRQGGRQLIIHNHGTLHFQASRNADESDWKIRAHLHRINSGVPALDFFSLLAKVFANLCEWLDELEQQFLVSFPGWDDSAWYPPGLCPAFRLPVGLSREPVCLLPDYFVLPYCDDNIEPLPWNFELRVPATESQVPEQSS